MPVSKSSAALAVLAAACCASAMVACGDDETSTSEGSGGATTTSATTTATGTSTSANGGAGGAVATGVGGGGGNMFMGDRDTISGDITWQVTFDAEAQAAGATNCSYTRHYEGVEDASAPWKCTQCEVIFRADVQMTAGETDCFSQVTDAPVNPTEWIGYGNGTWWRSGGGPLSDQGTYQNSGATLTTTNAVADIPAMNGGTLGFDVAGQFTTSSEMGDPMHGFAASDTYSCGWPKADPPPYTGDYTLATGVVVPDGLFKDRCGDTVRLHDFKGTYLMIDMSAADCPPCQSMASEEEAFIASMASQGIDVHVITLMAPSLTDPFGETSQALLQQWTDNFMLQAPVLADRSWGQAIFSQVFADGASYPSWVLVDPDLVVFEYGAGFGSFAEMQSAIVDHANL